MSTQSTDMGQHAPPLYGEHVLDQLYADVGSTGIMTPAPQSGMNTPFNGLSRSGSAENLASLNGVANQTGAVAPAALSSRLQNLDLNARSRNSSFQRLAGSGHHTPSVSRQLDGSYFEPHSNSEPNSNPLSRRTSEEETFGPTTASGQRTPDEHLDFAELGDLTKVPSYRTAVRMPARGMSYTDAVPDYNTAMSAPPSPERAFSNPVTPHQERRNPLSSMRFTAISPPSPVHTNESGRLPLHVLQGRGRQVH